MSRGPGFTELLDWVEGRLEGDRARRVADFVAVDDEAASTVAWIDEFLHAARRMPLRQPPAELSARLRAAFVGRSQGDDADGWSEADLLHDTRTQAASGIRSTVLDSAHLAFDSAAGRFVLEVRAAGVGLVDLEGLVLLQDSGAGAVLTFLEGDVVRRAVRVERDGRFEVSGMPETVDTLHLTSGDIRVRAALDLRHR